LNRSNGTQLRLAQWSGPLIRHPSSWPLTNAGLAEIPTTCMSVARLASRIAVSTPLSPRPAGDDALAVHAGAFRGGHGTKRGTRSITSWYSGRRSRLRVSIIGMLAPRNMARIAGAPNISHHGPRVRPPPRTSQARTRNGNAFQRSPASSVNAAVGHWVLLKRHVGTAATLGRIRPHITRSSSALGPSAMT
jgi:hypothetical protein